MNLKKTDTGPASGVNEEECRSEAAKYISAIGELQQKLYAEADQCLLVVLQGMDAAGKDGAIKKVFAEVNPMGCHVIAFKKPTPIEYAHDFLWRIHQNVPPYGMIHVFNRSQYEDIIVPTVEGYISEKVIKKRFGQINDFESMLVENRIQVVKFFLHVSLDDQEERLKERMTNPVKFWKHKDADWEARKKWDDYLDVYESIFEKCNKIEWNIIPSDKNWYKEYLIAKKILETLKEMDPKYPELKTNMK